MNFTFNQFECWRSFEIFWLVFCKPHLLDVFVARPNARKSWARSQTFCIINFQFPLASFQEQVARKLGSKPRIGIFHLAIPKWWWRDCQKNYNSWRHSMNLNPLRSGKSWLPHSKFTASRFFNPLGTNMLFFIEGLVSWILGLVVRLFLRRGLIKPNKLLSLLNFFDGPAISKLESKCQLWKAIMCAIRSHLKYYRGSLILGLMLSHSHCFYRFPPDTKLIPWSRLLFEYESFGINSLKLLPIGSQKEYLTLRLDSVIHFLK